MTLALLGDVLLYAVLPLHADAFGISLVWVGVLLSVNRFVRVFAYGIIYKITDAVGTRNMTVVAVLGASLSTLMYGFVDGAWGLLFARALWGLCFATLVLSVLAYAVTDTRKAGTRVGVSQSTQSIGPLMVLLGGTWLTTIIGPRDIFIWLGLVSLLALPLALTLPRTATATKPKPARPTTRRFKPSQLDVILFLLAVAVDGLFSFTATLMVAERVSVSAAVIGGGALLALRDITRMIVSPFAGMAGDRFGARTVFVTALSVVVLGLAIIGNGWLVTGAIVMLCAKAAAMALAPAVIVQSARPDESAMAQIARIQAARDLGAAVGPLMAGFLIAFATAGQLHIGGAVVLGIATFMFATAAAYKTGNR